VPVHSPDLAVAMPHTRILASLTALVLTASACDAGGVTQPRAVPGGEPSMLMAGPTDRVYVNCPSPIELGNSGSCDAKGYDANLVFTNDNPSAWWSSNTGVAVVSSTGYLTPVSPGSATVYATIDGVTGSAVVQVLDTVALQVQLDGSDTAEAGDYQCYFWATASGGTGSGYSYSWNVSGPGWGTPSGNSWTGGGSGDYTLTVTVTDSGSAQASDSISVDVFPSGGFGMPCFH
jgi:hypothetical protein